MGIPDVTDVEPKQEVYVTNTDIQHIEKFFEHFKIPLPDAFKQAAEQFKVNPTFANQEDLRFQLAKCVTIMKGHNPLVDEAFEKVMECTSEISYDLQFQKDLEEVIGVDPNQTDQSQSDPEKP